MKMVCRKLNLRLLMIVFLMLFSMSYVYSESKVSGLNIVLLNQNPDPVSPGNFVFVNVKVSNSGSDEISDVVLTMVENENFKIAQGSDISQDLGLIPRFSTGDSISSYAIAKYKVFVEPTTPLGLNILKFKLEGHRNAEYLFDVLVEDANPVIQVNNFSVSEIKPGESSMLEISIENPSDVDLENIVMNLKLGDVEGKVLSVKSGSNNFNIPLIKSGEKGGVVFEVVASPDADSRPYLLPVEISYEDSLGNSYVKDFFGSFRIYSEPRLSFSLDSQDIYSVGKGKVSFAIANFGTSSIKGTQVEILSSDDYEIISGAFSYIGDLNPDDFQTSQVQIYLKNSEDVSIKARVNYLDSYNREIEEIFELPLKIYSEDELEEFGISSESSNFGGVGFLVVAIVLVILAFLLGRRFGYNKAKRKMIKS